jgi:sugar/nucleoside kinase (ribokinase family)
MTEMPPVCIVGCASWDTLLPVDRYPPEGEYCIAAEEIQLPGGTSTNAAITLARLGLPPRFVGMVGDDWRGERLRAGLVGAGVICDTLAVRPGQDSDRSVIPISPSGARTIFWIKGAMLRHGDVLDLALIFRHRIVYLDIVDLALWRDVLDAYEAATTGEGRCPLLVGQAVFVAGVLPPDDALALIGRHGVFIGGEWEWHLMAGTATRDDLIARLDRLVHQSALGMAVVTHGAEGCTVVTRGGPFASPAADVTVVDTTGAGDAFAAGFMYGLDAGWQPERCARFANAVGGLATRAVGSQTSLPTLDEARRLAFGSGGNLYGEIFPSST